MRSGYGSAAGAQHEPWKLCILSLGVLPGAVQFVEIFHIAGQAAVLSPEEYLKTCKYILNCLVVVSCSRTLNPQLTHSLNP